MLAPMPTVPHVLAADVQGIESRLLVVVTDTASVWVLGNGMAQAQLDLAASRRCRRCWQRWPASCAPRQNRRQPCKPLIRNDPGPLQIRLVRFDSGSRLQKIISTINT